MHRFLLRVLAALVVAGGLVPVMSGTAWACSCVGYESQEAAIRAEAHSASSIYVGTVTAERSTGPSAEPGYDYSNKEYDIDVRDRLKGSVPDPRTIATAGNNSAACGITFEVGKPILVFEHGSNNVYSCGQSSQTDVEAKAAIVRDELKAAPSPSTSPSKPPSPTPSRPSRSPSLAPSPDDPSPSASLIAAETPSESPSATPTVAIVTPEDRGQSTAAKAAEGAVVGAALALTGYLIWRNRRSPGATPPTD